MSAKKQTANKKEYSPFCHFKALLPVMSGILIILSYPKFNYDFLAWVALTPLFIYVLKSSGGAKAFWGGYLCGFVAYCGLLYWIYPTMIAGGIQSYVAVLGLVLLSLLLGLEFGFLAWFGNFVRRTGYGAFPVLIACALACIEWLKITVNLKAVWFPWFTLAYTQWNRPELIQISSITGLYGLSWAICFTSALIACLICGRYSFLRRITGVCPSIFIIGGIWFYGNHSLANENAGDKEITLSVAMLQPCVDLYDKWDVEKEKNIKGELAELVQAAGKKDLILWPENALPGWIDNPEYSMWLSAFSKLYGSTHIVGSVSRGDGKRVSACLVTPEGSKQDYHKRILVPFGEYVPLREILGKFIEPIAALGEFKPGGIKQSLMTVKGVKIAPTICYESIFPFLYSSDAERGADLFVNITNDGWYLDTAAPHQHLIAGIFRAVETGKPILRAANNGISAYISPKGIIEASLNLNEKGLLETEITVNPDLPKTLYVQYGNAFVYLCLMLCMAFTVSLIFL